MEKISGGSRTTAFYEDYPEIEILAKVFVSEHSEKKTVVLKSLICVSMLTQCFTKFFVQNFIANRIRLKDYGAIKNNMYAKELIKHL